MKVRNILGVSTIDNYEEVVLHGLFFYTQKIQRL